MNELRQIAPLGFFKEKNQADFFHKNGYLIIDLSEISVIDQLTDTYHQLADKNLPKFLYTSHNVNELDKNLLVSNELNKILKEQFKLIFNAPQYILGHFVVKAANNNTSFPLHQDWNITDEKIFNSVHVWIPLQDTHKENGCMHVVPGSHLFFHNYRSGSLDIPRISIQPGYNSIVKDIYLKKGQALVYHPALFHGSYENSSSKDRIAILISLLEKDAPMQYYHSIKNGEIEIYNFTSEYLLANLASLEKGEAPVELLPATKIENRQLTNSEITFHTLKTKIKENKKNNSHRFFQRFKEFWNQ